MRVIVVSGPRFPENNGGAVFHPVALPPQRRDVLLDPVDPIGLAVVHRKKRVLVKGPHIHPFIECAVTDEVALPTSCWPLSRLRIPVLNWRCE